MRLARLHPAILALGVVIGGLATGKTAQAAGWCMVTWVVFLQGMDVNDVADNTDFYVLGREIRAKCDSQSSTEPTCECVYTSTDTEAHNIVKIEFVISEQIENDNGPSHNSPRLATNSTGICAPTPKVLLEEYSEQSLAISGDSATLQISGTVLDPIADNIPRGTVTSGKADIEQVDITVNGIASAQAQVQATTDGGASFWRQHPYKGTFSSTVETILAQGPHQIDVTCSGNALGNQGSDVVTFQIEKQTLTGAAIDAISPAASVSLNVYIPQEFSPSVLDSINFYYGNRDPLTGDPLLSEDSSIAYQTYPFLVNVPQVPSPLSADTLSLYFPPRNLSEAKFALQAELNENEADVITLTLNGTDIMLSETEQNTLVFFGTSGIWGDTTLTLLGPPGVDPSSKDFAQLTLQTTGNAGSLDENLSNRINATFGAIETLNDSNIFSLLTIIPLAETSVDTNIYLSTDSGYGTIILTLQSLTGLNPSSQDIATVCLSVPELFPSGTCINLLETKTSSKLFGCAVNGLGNEGTLVFTGFVVGTPVSIKLKNYSGLTTLADSFDAELTFGFPNGGISKSTLTFTETAADSNLFRASILVHSINGQSQGDAAEIWTVAGVQNHNDLDIGSYYPLSIRIFSPPSVLNPDDLAFSFVGSTTLLPLESTLVDGAYYLSGGSVGFAIIEDDPDDPGKLIVLYYDPEGTFLAKHELPKGLKLSISLKDRTKQLLKIAEKGIEVVTTDIDVDADRDGSVEDNKDEDSKEYTWTRGKDRRGAIILYNNDDDDGGTPNEVDSNDSIVNGSADLQDLAPILVRRIAAPRLPSGWKASIEVAQDSKVRIFSNKTDENTAMAILGAGTSSYDIPDPRKQYEYGIEGLSYPDKNFDGRIKVSLTVRDEMNIARAQDEVVMQISPWMMLSNLQPVEKVYVARKTSGQNSGFVTKLSSFVAGAGASMYIPSGATEPGHPIDDDVWMQDQFEIGYTKTSFGSMPVVVKSPRDGALSTFAKDNLLASDFGFFAVGGNPRNTHNGFGNLEVAPPVSVTKSGQTKNYKFGRIVYGYSGKTGLDREIREFLNAQYVQFPFAIDTSWLLVGHVDEVISFIPGGGTHGFKVLISSPRKAYEILEGLRNNGKGNYKLFTGVSDPLGQEPNGVTVNDFLDAGGSRFFLKQQNEVLSSIIFGSAQSGAAPAKPGVVGTLKDELGLSDSDFIEVPIIFTAEQGTRASGYTGPLTNLLVVNNTLIVPMAFGPRDPNAGARDSSSGDPQDEFEQYFKDSVGGLVKFIDAWEVYGLHFGGVHCGTNALRTDQNGKIGGKPWWEQE